MNMYFKRVLFRLVLVFLVAPLRGVTVNPALCPTNKIAPHRRAASWHPVNYEPRTFGAFYDLLAPGPPHQHNFDPSLLEEPQNDDLDDCGQIDDYDENDLSSLTPHYIRRQGNDKGKLFFGLFDSDEPNQYPPRPPPGAPRPPGYPQYGYPPNSQFPQNPSHPQYPQNPTHPQYPQNPTHPQYPQNPSNPQYPQNSGNQQYPQTQRPPRPQHTRPPYASGGLFGNNHYRPPIHHYPSDELKPVHEGAPEPQTTYRPHVVGGPIGHVVGVTPVAVRPRPTRRPDPQTSTESNYDRYPSYPYSKPRKLTNNDSILGSFIDLLFR